MEATGHYWMVLFERLTEAGYRVEVLNPLVIPARRNITIRGSKTDSVDALLIAWLIFLIYPFRSIRITFPTCLALPVARCWPRFTPPGSWLKSILGG